MKYLLIAAIALMACSSDDPTAPYPPTVIYINDAGTRAPAPMPTSERRDRNGSRALQGFRPSPATTSPQARESPARRLASMRLDR